MQSLQKVLAFCRKSKFYTRIVFVIDRSNLAKSLTFTDAHIAGLANVIKDLDKGSVKMDDGKYVLGNLYIQLNWVFILISQGSYWW